MAIPPTDIRILFTNYDIITYFLNLAFCSEHCISIKHRILATFNKTKKFNSDSLYAFNIKQLWSIVATNSTTSYHKSRGPPNNDIVSSR
jgi:hypothetical protein